ncbi:ATP-binding cassette domain-containing protein [Microlunatus elymi]|uniref:ATP-binding cassette domain-containing protein n=1 Tax=Microlunatus elymi TaxID=2596828 RepID=A0A516PUS8_9ACTN|nr:ATP-binding cassette domain-containing protein [Microlunatus elymi]QDP94948.1 ATP-binding cassette domain-containing protein [Microlunatus elymi]
MTDIDRDATPSSAPTPTGDRVDRAFLDEQARPTDQDRRTRSADPRTDLVVARGLDLGSGGFRVFSRLDFTIPTEALAVVVGGNGSGKSTLLLAMIGRSRGVRGSLRVAGVDAFAEPRKLHKISTAARIADRVDVEPRHSVHDALRERAAIEGLRNSVAGQRFREVADILQLSAPLDHLVEELPTYHRTLLAVALACLRPNTLLVLDDADRALCVDDQHRLYSALGSLVAETGTTMIVSTVEPSTVPYDAVRVRLPAAGQPTESDPLTRADQHSR